MSKIKRLRFLFLAIIIFIGVFIFSPSPSITFASTIVDADITEDTTWTASESPYIVNAEITVAENATLAIDPGVIVKLDYDAHIYVLGSLAVNSVASKKISVSSLYDSIGVDLYNDCLEYMPDIVPEEGIESCANTNQDEVDFPWMFESGGIISEGARNVSFSNVIFSHLSDYGLSFFDTSVAMDNVQIFDTPVGLYIYNSDIDISNSTFENIYDADAIILNDRSVVKISNTNVKSSFDYGGLTLYGSKARIVDSIFEGLGKEKSDSAIEIYDEEVFDRSTFTWTTIFSSELNASGLKISGHETGLEFYGGMVNIEKTKIFKNSIGLEMYLNSGSVVTIKESSIVDNDYATYISDEGAINIANNYWGDPTGPFEPDINPEGKGGILEHDGNNITFIPWLTSDPLEGCVTNCFSNVLFLPGLMGSRLYDPGLNCGEVVTGPECGEKALWVSINDALQEKLTLNTQGKSVNNIYTKNDTQNNGELDETGIVDDVNTFNIYQSFIDDLGKWKNVDKIIADYAFIPYDWRLSLDDVITNGATDNDNNLSYNTSQNFSESFILKKLEALQSNSKSDKVTIVAHSNGGLVAKALIQKLKDTNNPLYDKIDKVILIATPQAGTPDAVATLLHGSSLGHGLVMNADRSRQLSENMSSVYNLLPSSDYFSMAQIPFVADKLVTFENKPFFNPQISKYGLNISDEINLKNYILGTDGRNKPSFDDTVHPNIGNSALYTQAKSVHQILDSWQPSPDTKVIQVAGWGEETLAGLDYKSYIDFWGNEYLSYKPKMVIDGDGTVVVPSALWMTASPNVERWWVDLETYNAPFFGINRDHRDILEVQNLRDFIKSKIKDENSFTDASDVIVSDTSTLISNDLRRLHYTLHSPLTLGIIDIEGRYTGQDPITKQIREEIPNVNYRQIGDVQFISTPTGTAYTLKLQGYQEGSFSLDVDKQEGNDITASTSFQGISSSASTVATMNIAPDFEISSSILNIDQNGDGVTDKILNATPDGITIYDVTPPELQVTFDLNTKDVVFSGQDNHDPNPTVTITNTSIILTDTQSNTTIIPFTKYKENKTRLRFSYNKIIRNGITTIVPNTNIVYDWKEKKGVLADLDTKVTVKGVEKYTFNYKANVTTIKEKIGKNTTITKREGFVVVMLKTNEDNLNVSY